MQNRGTTRRSFLKTASGLALAPAVPLIPGLAHGAPGDLVVGTWGGDYQNLLQKFIAPGMQGQGIGVVYDTANATARATKVKAERNSRRGSMDVALLGDLDMYDCSTVGALLEPSQTLIPNLSHAVQKFVTPYSIPHIFSAMVLVYNREKFPTPPKSFAEALDPKLKGRVGFSDILYNFNTLFVGLSEGGKGESFEAGKKFLGKLKGNAPKVFPSNEALAAAFKSEEVWMACIWKARALQWRDAGMPLDFVIPEEGAIPVTFEAGVPKNSRNQDAAWKYLDALLAPEGQIQFASAMGYAPTVGNAQLPPELQARVGFTEDELKRIHTYDLPALARGRVDCLDYWNKAFKAGL